MKTNITPRTPLLADYRNIPWTSPKPGFWRQSRLLGAVTLAVTSPQPPGPPLSALASIVCLQPAACLPTPDPYAELLIGLWSQGERGAEGKSNRDPEELEITPRSSCTQIEGRVPTVREERRGEREIKEIGASLTELNTDQQHQILLFIQTLLCTWTRASLCVASHGNTLCEAPTPSQTLFLFISLN